MTISNDHLLCPSCGGETNTTDRAGEAQNCRDCTYSMLLCCDQADQASGWLKTLYEPFKFPPCDVCGKGDETRTGQIHGEHLCDDCEYLSALRADPKARTASTTTSPTIATRSLTASPPPNRRAV